MRAGEVLGMSAGEERSDLGGGGLANLAFFFSSRRSRSGLLQVSSFSGSMKTT